MLTFMQDMFDFAEAHVSSTEYSGFNGFTLISYSC